jgi:carbamoyltransferase
MEQAFGPAREPRTKLTKDHEDVAAALQAMLEEAYLHLVRAAHRRTGSKNLCLAGGVALNAVANGRIRPETEFEGVYVQPAAGDSGIAVGAADYVWNQELGKPRGFVMEHAYTGPQFTDAEAEAAIRAAGFQPERMDDAQLFDHVAGRIADGDVVGWFQGRMEWGARALGNRSILADPRRADMREIINTKIKFREKFRPFAPSILEEALDDYFTGAVPDPFMIQVYPVRPEKRAVIPAVTHVDGSGRLQTVGRQTNLLYWQLIKAFEKLTGVPVLLNTSFNENEPIVHRPEEALDCFLRTRMDVLVLGRTIVEKPPQTRMT